MENCSQGLALALAIGGYQWYLMDLFLFVTDIVAPISHQYSHILNVRLLLRSLYVSS